MDEIIHIFLIYGYPAFMAMFVVASFLLVGKERSGINFGLLVGFTMLLIGYCLQNYGPKEITYNQNNDAIISYTWAFTVGQLFSGFGLLVASASYLVKSLRHKNA